MIGRTEQKVQQKLTQKKKKITPAFFSWIRQPSSMLFFIPYMYTTRIRSVFLANKMLACRATNRIDVDT